MIVQCICWYDNKRSSKTYSCQLNSQQSKHTKVTNIYICSQLSQQPVRTVLISYFFSRFVQFCFFLFFVYMFTVYCQQTQYISPSIQFATLWYALKLNGEKKNILIEIALLVKHDFVRAQNKEPNTLSLGERVCLRQSQKSNARFSLHLNVHWSYARQKTTNRQNTRLLLPWLWRSSSQRCTHTLCIFETKPRVCMQIAESGKQINFPFATNKTNRARALLVQFQCLCTLHIQHNGMQFHLMWPRFNPIFPIDIAFHLHIKAANNNKMTTNQMATDQKHTHTNTRAHIFKYVYVWNGRKRRSERVNDNRIYWIPSESEYERENVRLLEIGMRK